MKIEDAELLGRIKAFREKYDPLLDVLLRDLDVIDTAPARDERLEGGNSEVMIIPPDLVPFGESIRFASGPTFKMELGHGSEEGSLSARQFYTLLREVISEEPNPEAIDKVKNTLKYGFGLGHGSLGSFYTKWVAEGYRRIKAAGRKVESDFEGDRAMSQIGCDWQKPEGAMQLVEDIETYVKHKRNSDQTFTDSAVVKQDRELG